MKSTTKVMQAPVAKESAQSRKLRQMLNKDGRGLQLELDIKPTGRDFVRKKMKKRMDEEIAAEEEALRKRLIGDTPRGEVKVEPRSFRDLTDVTSAVPIGIVAGSRFLEMAKPEQPKPKPKVGTAPGKKTETKDEFYVEPRNYRSMIDIESPCPESMKAASMLLKVSKRVIETKPKKGKAVTTTSPAQTSEPNTVASSSRPTPGQSGSPAVSAETAITVPSPADSKLNLDTHESKKVDSPDSKTANSPNSVSLKSSSSWKNFWGRKSLKNMRTKVTTVSVNSDPKGKGKAPLVLADPKGKPEAAVA